MKRPQTRRERVSHAYATRCYHSCRSCGRGCQFAAGYAHRFDCCGVVVVHALSWTRGGDDLVPVIIDHPMSRGWLTGPSRTEARRDRRRT